MNSAFPLEDCRGITVLAVVTQVKAGRSVELRLLTSQGWIAVGEVILPHTHRVPKVGSVVEVWSGCQGKGITSICQPLFLGERSDIQPHECIMAQLNPVGNSALPLK